MSFINELLSLSNTDINFKQYIKNKDLSIYQDGVITLEHFTDIMKKNIDYFKWYDDIKKNNKSNKKTIPESKYLFNDNVNSKSVLKLDLLQLPLLVNSYHQGEAHQQAQNVDIPPVPNTGIPPAPPVPNTGIPPAPQALALNADILKKFKLKKLQPQQKIHQSPKDIHEELKNIVQQPNLNQIKLQPQQIINKLMKDINIEVDKLKQKKSECCINEFGEFNDSCKLDDNYKAKCKKEIKDLTDKVNDLQKKFYKQQLNNLENQYSKLSLNNILDTYNEKIIGDIHNYLKNNQYNKIPENMKQYTSDDLSNIKERYNDIRDYIDKLYKKDDNINDNDNKNDIDYNKFFKYMILIIVPILLCFKYKIQNTNENITKQQKTINEKFVNSINNISKNYIKYIYKRIIEKEYFTNITYYNQIQIVFNKLYNYINEMNVKVKLKKLNMNDISEYNKFDFDLNMYIMNLKMIGGNNNLNKYINNIITLLNNDGDVDLTIFNLYNMLQINYLLALRLIEKTINCDIIKNNILYQKIIEEGIDNYIKNNYICFNFNNTINIQQNILFKDINCKHCIDIDNIINNIICGKFFIKKIKDDDFTYDNFINLISNYSNYKHILLILNESSLKSLFKLVKKYVKYITDNKINYVNSSLINFSYFVKNIIDKFINSDINSNDDINTDIEDIKNLYYNNFIFENNYVICYIIWNKLKNIYKPHTKITSYEPKYIKHDILNMIKKQSNTIKYNNDNKINNFFINNKLHNNKVNVLFEINKMATMNGGNLNKDMYTTIYEQIFDNIQNKLKSHKIKINQNDIIKITNKINDIKQYEKELIKIFKIMAKYTSQHNLTKLKHTEINYDMMKNFDDKYNKLCNNHNIAIIDIINTFNKINNRISNIIN